MHVITCELTRFRGVEVRLALGLAALVGRGCVRMRVRVRGRRRPHGDLLHARPEGDLLPRTFHVSQEAAQLRGCSRQPQTTGLFYNQRPSHTHWPRRITKLVFLK